MFVPNATCVRLRSAAGALAGLLIVQTSSKALADTVVFQSGKRIEDVVVSRHDEETVVVNRFNSRCAEMTWGVEPADRFPASKVAEVVIADPPLVEYRERASRPGLSAAEHLELADFCERNKLKEERDRELKLALCADPGNETALAALGRSAWNAWAAGNPAADESIRELEREYLKLAAPEELDAQLDLLHEKGGARPLVVLERARRSAKQPKGRRDKVPLTLRSDKAPGGTYCVYVPESYDPLVATGLVVGLHGGGGGGRDETIVTGSGESAMNFYVDVADQWGFVVVCPTALAAGWASPKNEPLIDAVIEEMLLLFNVDESRVYLTGHSMGGGGAWQWGPARAEVWAAFSPCAGWGGPNGCDGKSLPVYIYHGGDDAIVAPGSDRSAATSLASGKKKADFVYTEIDGVGHGFPDWVRKDIFRFFAGRWKDQGKKRAVWPRSSFERKVINDEVNGVGVPSALPSGAPADSKLADLVARLEKGGGGGLDAARELAERKDIVTAKAVGKVLRSKKASTDARVLAAKTLGEIGLPECVKQLATCAEVDDFRVVDAVVWALGKTGLEGAVDPLVRSAKRLGLFWEGSFQGRALSFTEYEIRCRSFASLADALAEVRLPADVAIPLLQREVVERVFTPKTAYTVPIDDRFVHIPPGARLLLTQRLRAFLVAVGDPRGKAMLAAIRDAWKSEAALVGECAAGIGELGG